jgi:hypothetical protein
MIPATTGCTATPQAQFLWHQGVMDESCTLETMVKIIEMAQTLANRDAPRESSASDSGGPHAGAPG